MLLVNMRPPPPSSSCFVVRGSRLRDRRCCDGLFTSTIVVQHVRGAGCCICGLRPKGVVMSVIEPGRSPTTRADPPRIVCAMVMSLFSVFCRGGRKKEKQCGRGRSVFHVLPNAASPMMIGVPSDSFSSSSTPARSTFVSSSSDDNKNPT
jgi:hypothetical protein